MWEGLCDYRSPSQAKWLSIPAVCSPEVELSVSLAPCLVAYSHASLHDDNELNLRNSKPALIKLKFAFIRVAVVLVSLHSNENPTKTPSKLADLKRCLRGNRPRSDSNLSGRDFSFLGCK